MKDSLLNTLQTIRIFNYAFQINQRASFGIKTNEQFIPEYSRRLYYHLFK